MGMLLYNLFLINGSYVLIKPINIFNIRSISLWDLKEDEMCHHRVVDKANERNWTIRMSTYTTTNTETNIYTSQIVAIRILSKIEEKSLEQRGNKFVPIQVC